ncbi:hypothetical protein OAM06_01895 [Pelagibacteraceae bacterium]|nr:hypothetical protein [Pelagibacteraceae bacterium]|tara:strand:- start:705 stop:929 length:225 start_codon:yes stop_codon:yes gene_type:complete
MKINDLGFFIVITGVWGLATVLIILGFPFFIIDEIFGTNLISIIDQILSGGYLAIIKIWFCGLPLSLLTDSHKK